MTDDPEPMVVSIEAIIIEAQRQRAELEKAYRAYLAAPFGQLTATADALRLAAVNAGYEFGCGLGPVQWTETMLGVK